MALPISQDDQDSSKDAKDRSYRVAYAVHESLDPTDPSTSSAADRPTRFVGIVTAKSINGPMSLVLPAANVDPRTHDSSTLSIELGYNFLPRAWGKGYATESVGAVLESLKTTAPFWAPYKKLYVRALVNEENPASQKVMQKLKMDSLGIYEWRGDKIFLGGKWIEVSRVHIYGKYLIE